MVPKLEQYAYQQEKYKSGRNVSNIGGHQTDFITIEEEPLYEELVDRLMPEIRNTIHSFGYRDIYNIIVGQCWMNINRKGHLNLPHIHSNTDWACIFYIKSDEKTSIRFHNTDQMRGELARKIQDWNDYNCAECDYLPKENDFIMIPAHIQHSVAVNNTDNVRISLAFNVKIA
tara:strand:- start:31 stop:549 length:519 start_codon:yes stop_codon:yes gene_type:complete